MELRVAAGFQGDHEGQGALFAAWLLQHGIDVQLVSG
jgi:hypothetical protein